MHFLFALLFAVAPSRPPFEGCKWERLSDPKAGLEAWVQRCDFKGSKTALFMKDRTLYVRYSDVPKPEALIDVYDLLPNETAEAGLARIYAAHTEKKIASRCVLAPYHEDAAPPKGVKRFTFVPNAKYQKELDAKRSPDDGVPDPACGDLGDQPDSVQYWETQSGARRVLLIRAGQDDPPFDEKTLRILP